MLRSYKTQTYQTELGRHIRNGSQAANRPISSDRHLRGQAGTLVPPDEEPHPLNRPSDTSALYVLRISPRSV